MSNINLIPEQPLIRMLMQITLTVSLRNISYALVVVLALLSLSSCENNHSAQQPVPATVPLETLVPTRGSAQDLIPVESIPPLNGSIIFLTFVDADAAVVAYDVATDLETTIFEVPANGWVTHLDASPDYSQLVLAYTPPANWNGPQVAESSLFLLPADGSSDPELILGSSTPQEAYITPAWSADGQHIYYSHMSESAENGEATVRHDLERINQKSGEIEVILPDAVWPSLSPNGALLAYLTSEPGSSDSYLYLADIHGKASGPAFDPDAFKAVDAQIFTPGSDYIYFSGAIDESDQSLLDSLWSRIIGLGVAYAHSFPADWWRFRVDGGEPERLTDIQEIGLAGAFSPDGQHIAFIGSQGIYVMQANGSGLSHIKRTVTFGTVAWIP